MKRFKKEEEAKEPKPYSWTSTEGELSSTLSEPEVAYCHGKCTKEEVSYPWAPTKAELCAVVAEAEANYRHGRYIEEEDMNLFFDSLK